MSNVNQVWLWFEMQLEEHAEEGRDVQLFDVQGQRIFPMIAPSGGIYSDPAVFPILRGSGDRAPKFEGAFPTEDGDTLELGQGWIVMCVRFPYHSTPHEKIAKLQEAEEKLRAMKSGGN